MKSRWIALTAILVVLMLVAACGGKEEPTSTPAPEQPVAEIQQEEPTPAEKAAASSAEEIEPTAEPEPTASVAAEEEDLTVDDRSSGLDQMESYRSRWMAEWKVGQGADEEVGAWEWSQEAAADGNVHYVWSNTDPATGTTTKGEWWQIGNTMSMLNYDEQGQPASCFTVSSEESEPQSGMFNPSSLGSVSGAKYKGRETVNGIRTKHYVYDSGALTLLGSGKASGEMWVAEDGGYVVKDVVNWEGKGILFASASDKEGTGSWTWELSDVNQTVEIAPPPDICKSASEGIPIMPDAKEKASFGDIITYQTPSSVADAKEFYLREMPAAGWALEGEPSEMGPMATLQFTKEDQSATVTIIGSDDATAGTQVMVNVTKP